MLILQIDIHDGAHKTTTSRLDVSFTPTFVLFGSDGEELWRQVGAIDPDGVQEAIDRYGQG